MTLDQVPEDWENPDWSNVQSEKDWKKSPDQNTKDLWHTFSEEQKKVLSNYFYSIVILGMDD